MILYEESRQDISILITANIGPGGDVRIEGIDSGSLVRELKGDADYEYNLTIPVAEKVKLFEHLQIHGEEGVRNRELLKWLKENFDKNNCFSAIMTYLKQAGITYETFFWE